MRARYRPPDECYVFFESTSEQMVKEMFSFVFDVFLCFSKSTVRSTQSSHHLVRRGTAFQAIVGCMLDSEGVAPGYSPRAKARCIALQANDVPNTLKIDRMTECHEVCDNSAFMPTKEFF